MFFGYYYTPIFFLQAFCLYHAYSKNVEQRWFYLIIFLPLIGCLLYVYANFFGDLKKGVKGVSQGVQGLINSNYQVEKLERKINFSDTAENKMRLSEAYIDKGRYADALALLKSCEKGVYKDDVELLLKLLKVNYLADSYSEAIQYGEKLKDKAEFRKAAEKIAYAWALHYEGRDEEANQAFMEMDMPYSNYKNRFEYAKFLIESNGSSQAKEKLKILVDEIGQMDRYERKQVRGISNEIKALYQSI